MIERSWKNQMQNIKFIPEDSNYYNNFPIQPGFHFFKCLINAKSPP